MMKAEITEFIVLLRFYLLIPRIKFKYPYLYLLKVVNVAFELYRVDWQKAAEIEEQVKGALLRAHTVHLLSSYYKIVNYGDTFEHFRSPNESVTISIDLNSIEEFIAAASLLIAMSKAKELEDVKCNGKSIADTKIEELPTSAAGLGLAYLSHP